MKEYGFVYQEPAPEDYIFGAGQISTDKPLVPDGQWTEWLPDAEIQDRNGFETYVCASQATEQAVKILQRRLFGFKDNYSARWLAQKTGTGPKRGNSPHIVAEYWRHQGIPDETSWPFKASSYDDFYRDPPTVLDTEAARFPRNYNLFHDYVPNDAKSMMEALRFSPLGISVEAWELDKKTGLYKATAPAGRDNHWVVCYGYEQGKCWLIFDSYDSTHKKLEWKHRPMTVKRYHIEIAPAVVEELNKAQKALQWFLSWLPEFMRRETAVKQPPVSVPLQPAPIPTPTPKWPGKVEIWAKAIEKQEGGKPGDLNMRLNNPGNLKYSTYTASLGAADSNWLLHLGGKRGPDGSDGGSFCRFDTYKDGFDALCTFLIDAANNELRSYKNCTLAEFTRIYAHPPNSNYANAVAKALQVDPATPIKNLIS